MDDFDKQLNDWIDGISKPRSVLSGTWRHLMTRAIEWEDLGWECTAAHEGEDGTIEYTMLSPDGWATKHTVSKEDVCFREALAGLAVIVYDYHNEPSIVGKAGVQYWPDGVRQEQLWYECWQTCDGDTETAHKMYLERGGEISRGRDT